MPNINPQSDAARRFKRLVALCWFVYFVSYLTRQNYAAMLAPMLEEFAIGKAQLSIASTAGFITYGAGQFCCGLLLRRMRAQKLLLHGLLATAGCNVVMAALTTLFANGIFFSPQSLPWSMAVVWGINGFAQAMLWPSLVLLMAQAFTPDEYKRACVSITIASSFGTVAVYLLVPLCTQLGSWRSVFLLCALAALAAAVLWQRGTGHGEIEVPSGQAPDAAQPENAQPFSVRKLLFDLGIFPVLIAVALHGILRDGVTTWMPVMITEGYPGFSASKSVLTAAILPLFAALSIRLAGRIERKLGSEFRGAVLFFALGTASAAALPFVLGRTLPATVALLALLTGCMHGVNLMLVCELPARFQRFNCTGLAAGLINSFTYLGSSVSMFGIALLAEGVGWRVTAVIWAAIALAGTLLCWLCTGKLQRSTAAS